MIWLFDHSVVKERERGLGSAFGLMICPSLLLAIPPANRSRSGLTQDSSIRYATDFEMRMRGIHYTLLVLALFIFYNESRIA